MNKPRCAARRLASGLVALALLWTPRLAIAGADAFKSCSQSSVGQHSCPEGTICVCTALPDNAPRIGNGYFWDCAPGNGTCGGAPGGASAILDLVRPQMSTPAAPAVDDLQRGEIARLQARLNTLGFAAGPADGIIGPQTREAIRQYESQKGYMVEGLATRGLLSTLQ